MPAQSLLGTSPALSAVREEVSRLLSRPATTSRRLPPILIQGETGTGKGLVAHLIHQTGPRADAAFVDVNCAAIPDTLLEAELFGFERGAFTDARQAKAGLLQMAHRGTIFLDEIGLMPDALQVKLLKALEERCGQASRRHAHRAGGCLGARGDERGSAGGDPHAALSRRPLSSPRRRHLRLPPLRERGDDILLLARHYLGRACVDYGLPAENADGRRGVGADGLSWPGNVRELANVMERVVLLSDGEQVTAATLGLPRESPARRGLAEPGRRASNEQMACARARAASRRRCTRTAGTSRVRPPSSDCRETRCATGWSGMGSPMRSGGARPVRHRAISRCPRPMPPPPVRWQRTRVTLLHVHVADADATVARARAPRAARAGGREGERLRRADHRSRCLVGGCGVRSRVGRRCRPPCRPRRACQCSARVRESPAHCGSALRCTRTRCSSAVSRIASSSTPTRVGRPMACSTGCWPQRRGEPLSRPRRRSPFWSDASRSSPSASDRSRCRRVARHRAR